MHDLIEASPQKRSTPELAYQPASPQVSRQAVDGRAAAGNLAIERMLAAKTIQASLRVSQPGDASEQEADRVAEQVTSTNLRQPGQEAALPDSREPGNAGSSLQRQAGPAPGRSLVVNRGLEGPMDGLRGGGQPLPQSARSIFEPSFGRDFGAVQIHTGPAAAQTANRIGARAYTYGTNIAFAQGEYAPESSAGRRLLAHELTHVVQQESTTAPTMVQRDPAPTTAVTPAANPASPGPAAQLQRISSFDDFEQRVFSRATGRLDDNRAQLDKWRAYITSQFDDIELKAQLAGTESLGLISSARQLGRERFIEPYFAARSPADRAVDEAILNGQINDGCGECHARQISWRWNLSHPEFQHGPTTAEQLQGLANYVTLMGTHRPGQAGQNPPALPGGDFFQTGNPAQAAPGNFIQAGTFTQAAPGNFIQAANPAQANPGTAGAAEGPTTITAPPAALTYPTIHSDLCGDVPPESVEPAPFNPALWGPNTALAVSAIQQIHPVLEPLGPAGYKVLPKGIFSNLYDRTPAQLRALVMENIDERQGKYMGLKWLIQDGHVDYKELCPIVAELLPQADPGVQFYVNYDIAQQRIWDTFLDILLALVSAALILLTILFPPAIFLTAGLLVGALQVGVGMRDVRRGYLYEMGTGANVFSQEQEASGPALVTGGWLNIGLGTLSVVTSGAGLSRLSNAPGSGMDLAVRGPTGRFQPLADGSYMAIHPQNPNVVVILEGDQLTAGIFVEGEFKPLATAPSPWPAGMPPPGTPTWAEWAAANGVGSYGEGFSGGFSGGTSRGPMQSPLALPPGGGFYNPGEIFVLPEGGPGALVPYRPGALVPYRPGALVPFRPSPSAIPPFGSSGFAPFGGSPLLASPRTPLLLTGQVGPIVDPGGRGLFTLSEAKITALATADAARLRILQTRMPASQADLEDLVMLRRLAVGSPLPLTPGTPEHMLTRWYQYKSPPRNGPMSFQQWAAGHPSRMTNSVVGPAREESYQLALAEGGVPVRNAVLRTESGQLRQVDLLIEHGANQPRDLLQIKAGEESLTTTPRKSGGASLGSASLSNEDALVADAEFIKSKDRVTWVFEQRPSGPLVSRARSLGVDVIIRVDDAPAQTRMIELMKRAGMSQAQIDSVTFFQGSLDDLVTFVARRFGAK